MAARGGKKIVIVKKKIMGGGGHHGGSWKVAYADFVTAMMAFFMVMWILGMDDKTKKAIEGYFANPVGYKKGYGAGASPLSTGTTPANVQKTALRMIVRSSEQRTFEALKAQIKDKLAIRFDKFDAQSVVSHLHIDDRVQLFQRIVFRELVLDLFLERFELALFRRTHDHAQRGLLNI